MSRHGERARFDQQPVEAQTMASACLEAYRSTGDERWRTEARRAFEWFLGRNDLNLPLYDPTTGAAATASIPTAPMRIKARSRRWPFSRLYWSCAWLRIPFKPV
jgi:hypothetical protein